MKLDIATVATKSGIAVITGKTRVVKAVGAAATPAAPVPVNTASLKKENEEKDTLITSGSTNIPSPTTSVWGVPIVASKSPINAMEDTNSTVQLEQPQNQEVKSPVVTSASVATTTTNITTSGGAAKPAPWASANLAHTNNSSDQPGAFSGGRKWAEFDEDDSEEESSKSSENKPAAMEEWPNDFRETLDDILLNGNQSHTLESGHQGNYGNYPRNNRSYNNNQRPDYRVSHASVNDSEFLFILLFIFVFFNLLQQRHSHDGLSNNPTSNHRYDNDQVIRYYRFFKADYLMEILN